MDLKISRTIVDSIEGLTLCGSKILTYRVFLWHFLNCMFVWKKVICHNFFQNPVFSRKKAPVMWGT